MVAGDADSRAYSGACDGVPATGEVPHDVKERMVGVLTGLSPVSGGQYYKAINEGFQRAVGMGAHVPRNPLMAMVSVDLSEYARLLFAGDYDAVGEYLLEQGARRLVACGAEFIAIASNTAHCGADVISAALPETPLLHIADVTACAIRRRVACEGEVVVGLLGTEFTMRGEYLKARLARHGVRTIIPDDDAVLADIFRAIMKELSVDVFKDSTRARFVDAVRAMHARGAGGVILGCTEIELLLRQEDVPEVPLFPSAALHIDAITAVVTRQVDVGAYAPCSSGGGAA